MLKKENRLKSRRAFSATYHNNETASDDIAVIYLGKPKTSTDCPTRVGFVVSKKVHKRAVKRNRIKRLMRENIRLIIKNNEFPEIHNYQSLILLARANALDKTKEEIKTSILTLLNKLANKNI